MDHPEYKRSCGLIITAVWNMNSSRAVRQGRSSGVDLRQLGADEPEGVAGSCDVIGSVISDCKNSA
jgi:hypothetical protein